jgi:hypothetical protein
VLTLEQVQERIRKNFPKSDAPVRRELTWQRISREVLRADDYEIHRALVGGIYEYKLFRLPFHEELWGPSATAEECKEQAALHQVLVPA